MAVHDRLLLRRGLARLSAQPGTHISPAQGLPWTPAPVTALKGPQAAMVPGTGPQCLELLALWREQAGKRAVPIPPAPLPATL